MSPMVMSMCTMPGCMLHAYISLVLESWHSATRATPCSDEMMRFTSAGGTGSYAAMARDDIDTVRVNFERAQAVIAALEEEIEAKRASIAELDRGPAVVHTPASNLVPLPPGVVDYAVAPPEPDLPEVGWSPHRRSHNIS